MNRAQRNFGGITAIMLGALGLLVVGIITFVVMRSGIDDGSSGNSADIYRAKTGSFDVTIPCSGELAAQQQIEIRNKLESRAVITYIVPEGTTVKAGDLLITLAEEEILNKIKDAEDGVKTAEAALIAAQASYDIQISQRDSDLAKAELDVRLAQLALDAWSKGDLESKRQELDTALKTAEINFDRLTEKYKESQRLLAEGFISKDECDRDRIELIEAEAAFKKAEQDKDVYEKYTYFQDEAKFNSDLEQAQKELERVKQRHDAELGQKMADVESKKHQFASKQERLADAQREHSYCKITAPSGGLVVYNSSLESGGWRGMDEGPPQIGTELRPNERVMVLPDTSQMMAVVKVNEALSGSIKPGQRASITSDAVPGAQMIGEVQSVGVLAEQGGWRDPNRRDYSVKIAILSGYTPGLKPSMRCQATVFVNRVDDVLFVPVQAVFRNGPDSLVYVPQGGGYAEKRVELGQSSELHVEVTDGLTDGDAVLLRKPALNEVVSTLPRKKNNGMPSLFDEAAPNADEQQAQGGAPKRGPGGPNGQRGDRPRGDKPKATENQPTATVDAGEETTEPATADTDDEAAAPAPSTEPAAHATDGGEATAQKPA